MERIIGAIALAMAILTGAFFGIETSKRTKLLKAFQSKPYLELSGTSPYDLRISEFRWGYGRVAVNEFSGDFKKLDEKVFDLLKGKEGTVKVFIDNVEKDQYGRGNSTSVYIGDLNLSELNKYEDWEYWNKHSGIQALLYKKYVKIDNASIEADSLAYYPGDVTSKTNPKVISKANPPIENREYQERPHFNVSPTFAGFILPHKTMWPSILDQDAHDNMGYKRFKGSIFSFDFNAGIMELETESGTIEKIKVDVSNLSDNYRDGMAKMIVYEGVKVDSFVTVFEDGSYLLVAIKFIVQE